MKAKLSMRTLFLILCDVLAAVFSCCAALGVAGLWNIFVSSGAIVIDAALCVVVVLMVFAIAHQYSSLWEYASAREFLHLAVAAAAASVAVEMILLVTALLLGSLISSLSFLIVFSVLLVICTGARFLFPLVRHHGGFFISDAPEDGLKRTLVIGAGETGSVSILRMQSGDYSLQGIPVIAVDDDPSKWGMRIHGVRVAGSVDDIPELVKRFDIAQIVLAIPTASFERRKQILSICLGTDAHVMTIPPVQDIPSGGLSKVKLQEINLADLLGREEIKLDTHLVSNYISGKVVLITGGGGSIGSELARQVALTGPAMIVIFDIYENTAYELFRELAELHPQLSVKVEIGSIRDEERLERLFNQYHPEVLFHAAAHKHVPLMEGNPREAVLNNVFGTLNVCRMAEKYHIERFTFISTDKAVNPTNVMGATKRMGEMIIQYFAAKTDCSTIFAAVRFGNVLGSHGSVVPLFRRQIEHGGPVTVTHPDITRYFMTIPEASALVVMTGAVATGGEVFVLDMGNPVRIVDLAENMIRFSGLRVGEDIQIEFTGLRPGEKLYEELLMDSETTVPTDLDDIHVSTEEPFTQDEVKAKLDALEMVINGTNQEIKDCLVKQVPTYHPENAGVN